MAPSSSPWGASGIRPEELDGYSYTQLCDLVNTPGVYTSLTVARAYARMGLRPIPLCDHEHKRSSVSHTNGYVNRRGYTIQGCTSHGKAPVEHNWQRFSEAAPSDADLVRMFRNHQGNIGTAIPKGRVVADVDPRSGGEQALERYEIEHGKLPNTVTAITGSGGQHIWFTLPPGLSLSAGGSLGSYGYGGLEWKAARGQVVLSPSIHPATGRPYQWEQASLPGEVALAACPAPLLALIQSGPLRAIPGSPQRVAPDGSMQARHTPQTTARAFTAVYAEGERRSSGGLPRLVGFLIAWGVPLHRALEFLQAWQLTHCDPPLAADEIATHVTAMYDRYPHPEHRREASGTQRLARIEDALCDAFPLEAVTAVLVAERGGGDPSKSRSHVRERAHARRRDLEGSDGDGGVTERRVTRYIDRVLGELIEDAGADADASAPAEADEKADTGTEERAPETRYAMQHAGDNRALAETMIPLNGEVPAWDRIAMHRKDNPRLGTIFAGPSKTWAILGNAIIRRQIFLMFYVALATFILESAGNRGLYLVWYKLHPETQEEDKRWLGNLKDRIRSHGFNWAQFICHRTWGPEEERGTYACILTDHADKDPLFQSIVPTEEDLVEVISGLLPAPVYGMNHAVRASEAWQMPSTRTGEYEVDTLPKLVLDAASYTEDVDAAHAQKAREFGLRTWVASDEEIMARAPGSVTHTRHFLVPEDQEPEALLLFWQACGFKLTDKAEKRLLEAERAVVSK